MRKFGWIVAVFIFIIIYLYLFRQPFNFLSELDQLRYDLIIKEDNSFNYTQFYKLENYIDSIIASGELVIAQHILDSLLINRGEDEFSYAWYFRRGRIYYLKKEFANAEQNFSFAINSTEKMELQSYFWRSFTLAQLGKCKEAIEDFKFIKLHSSKYNSFEKNLHSFCNFPTE